jgi:hypothetical protein
MPEHEDSIYDIPAAQRKMLLEAMLNGPAFALFCDRIDTIREKELDAKIFAVGTTDEDTRVLKKARELVTGTKHPRKIVEAMIRGLNNDHPAQKNHR